MPASKSGESDTSYLLILDNSFELQVDRELSSNTNQKSVNDKTTAANIVFMTAAGDVLI